jgi:hypothetical protein
LWYAKLRAFLPGANVARTKQPSSPGSGAIERRRSDRFPLVVPVTLKWQNAKGQSVQCEARAVEGNGQGGFLEAETLPTVGTAVEVRNVLTGQMTHGRVVRVRHAELGQTEGVGVAFSTPSPDYWGPTFRLKKATAELRELEEEIRTGGFHPQVLRDFRDAVDYVRKTAWAVEEWQERQTQRRDTATVLPLLTAERIRRNAQLSRAIVEDLRSRELTPETEGVAELSEAIATLHRLLAALLK